MRVTARLGPTAAVTMRSTRRSISAAARRENVSNRMQPGSAPLTIRWATRCARVLVLPEPAPAICCRLRGDTHEDVLLMMEALIACMIVAFAGVLWIALINDHRDPYC